MTAKKVVKKGSAASTKKKRQDAWKDDHPLADHVPSEWMYDEYVSRSIAGVKDIDVLRYARKTRQNVLMSGPTGPGKTSCVEAYAAADGLPLVTVPCNGAIDPATLFVEVYQDEDGKFRKELTPVVLVLMHGGVLYLDEVNFTPARIMAVLHSALDKRRTVHIPEARLSFTLHPEAQIVGTYNPEYEGTRPLNEAFQNRYALQLEFGYDPDVEKELVTGIPVLLDIASKLRVAHEDGDIETPVGPNILLEFEQFAWDLGLDFATEMFVSRFKSHEKSAVRNTLEHYADIIQQQFEEAKRLEAEEG